MYKIKEFVKKQILSENTELINLFEEYMKNDDNFMIFDEKLMKISYNPFYSPYTLENPQYYLNQSFEKMKISNYIYNFDTFDTSWCERHPLWISRHPYPVTLMENNIDNLTDLDWYLLSFNPYAIRLLEENFDKIHWYALSCNPAALHLMAQCPGKVYYTILMENPGIYELDFNAIRKRLNIYREELIQKAVHPSRIDRLIEIMGDEFDFEKMI